MDYIAGAHKASTGVQSQAESFTLRQGLLGLSRAQKRVLKATADALMVWCALWLAFYLRLDSVYAAKPFDGHAWLFIAAPLLTLGISWWLGLYRAVTRYVGHQAMAIIAVALTGTTLILAFALFFYNPSGSNALIPRSVLIIHWLLSFAFLAGSRLAMQHYLRGLPRAPRSAAHIPLARRAKPDKMRVAIYGAGAAGNQLLLALRLGRGRQPVAFIDDSSELTGRVIAGLPVYAPHRINELIKNAALQEILLAMPSATRMRRAQIVNFLTPYPVRVRSIPGFMDLASGRVQVQDLREVDISDLLGRDPVLPDSQLFARCIRDQAVLVTGAGGSIGAELCRQIVSAGPRTLILYEQCEYNLYKIQSELDAIVAYSNLNVAVIPVLNTVRREDRLEDVMRGWNVNTVYHAAAYKHVPMVERNIAEGVLNNVFGTLYSAQAALRAGVENFVLISTDKAVRPTNTMGCTKRMAELVLQALALEAAPTLYGDAGNEPTTNRTRYTMVRFGNVLGSSGSVIPRFREQIRAGGPITITHPEITRYFMTIPEAAQLVIQAGSMGQGGDVFVLDMGKPVKIVDLAAKMVQLSGLSVRSREQPDGDIALDFVGLRPGEKLYEELLIGDNAAPTEHPMIMRANETRRDWNALKQALASLEDAVQHDDYERVRALFFEFVDGYRPDNEMVDWVQMQQAAGRMPALRHEQHAAGLRSDAVDACV